MSEKKPQAGEWWQEGLSRYHVCGFDQHGNVIAETVNCVHVVPSASFADMTHLPDCDSFEWQPEPVESPDDWVEFDGGLVAFPRLGIDELKHATESSFAPAIQEWHGKSQQWQVSMVNYKVHCRRKDLPPILQETPKRDYVRVWMRWHDDKLYATATGCDDPKDRELKHDGIGFYLEERK